MVKIMVELKDDILFMQSVRAVETILEYASDIVNNSKSLISRSSNDVRISTLSVAKLIQNQYLGQVVNE